MNDARERLHEIDASYELDERLHDVPPHQVWALDRDGERGVLKFDTGPAGSAHTEGIVTRFVGNHTPVPVPRVRRVGDDWYLADWNPDAPAPDGSHAADESWARAAGRALARLHTDSAPRVDGYGVPERNDGRLVAPQDTWHEAALAALRRRRTLLSGSGYADVVAAVLDHLRSHPDAFAGTGPSVCCHGWWSPEHVAVDGDVCCVVDFEHAMAAPAGWDYLRAVRPTFADGDAAVFRAGYESVRPIPAGVDRTESRRALDLLGETYYLVSLFVQDQHTPAATERRAEAFADRIYDRI